MTKLYEAILRWCTLILLAALPCVGLINSVDPLVGDMVLYQKVGDAVLAGEVPYRDFFVEYPPGALPVFVLPAFAAPGQYATFFAAEMALLLAVAILLTGDAARRMGRPWLPPALTVAAGVWLLPIASSRYDALVAFALAVTVWAAVARRPALAWAFLGFGTLAKLTPLVVAGPLFLVRRGRWRGLLAFAGVLLAGLVPAFLANPNGFAYVFSYHAQRGLQLESLASSVLLGLGLTDGVSLRYGAWEVVGGWAEAAASSALPVTLALLLVTLAVAWREHNHGRFGPDQFPRYAAAVLLAFLVGSKVLSPQFMVWLLPLVPLALRGAWGVGASATFLLACWVTIPMSGALNGGSPALAEALQASAAAGPASVIDVGRYIALAGETSLYGAHPLAVLLGRNALLLGLWIVVLLAPDGGGDLRRHSRQGLERLGRDSSSGDLDPSQRSS